MTLKDAFEAYVSRKVREYGERFDASELYQRFARYFHGPRVKVAGPTGIRFGRVSVTTGWRPAFLLMHRSSDTGSWDVLGIEDRVVAVKQGSRYVKVSGE